MRKNGVATLGRSEVHPIPRRAINNIPILDTIHLEINRQPIGKPGQIDFEIDNLRALASAFTHPLIRSLISFRLVQSLSSERQATVAGAEFISNPHRIRERGSLREDEKYAYSNYKDTNHYRDKHVTLNYNILHEIYFQVFYYTSQRSDYRDILLKCKSFIHV